MLEEIVDEIGAVMNILIGSSIECYVAEKKDWGKIVRFEFEGKQLMCHSIDYINKELEVFYWAPDKQYSCWGFEEEMNLIEGYTTASHDVR